ncbi:uncharacterized protein LOC116602330 [Nematostella vectensis]|uniref:uncharacterized protein LOC116602330 n=1 Tax=Nematostella vectensis TaxID=45351 RepID=UPI002076DD35|nr:uncharacterized protein LOC116602330 [Nematostella vectensis]
MNKVTYSYFWVAIAACNTGMVGMERGSTEFWSTRSSVSPYFLFVAKRIVQIVCLTLYFIAFYKFIKYTQGWWLQWRIAHKPGYDPRAGHMGGSRRLTPDTKPHSTKQSTTLFLYGTGNRNTCIATIQIFSRIWINSTKFSGFLSRAHAPNNNPVPGKRRTRQIISMVAMDTERWLFPRAAFRGAINNQIMGTRLMQPLTRTGGARLCSFSDSSRNHYPSSVATFKPNVALEFDIDKDFADDAPVMGHDSSDDNVPEWDYIRPVLCCGGLAFALYVAYRYIR